MKHSYSAVIAALLLGAANASWSCANQPSNSLTGTQRGPGGNQAQASVLFNSSKTAIVAAPVSVTTTASNGTIIFIEQNASYWGLRAISVQARQAARTLWTRALPASFAATAYDKELAIVGSLVVVLAHSGFSGAQFFVSLTNGALLSNATATALTGGECMPVRASTSQPPLSRSPHDRMRYTTRSPVYSVSRAQRSSRSGRCLGPSGWLLV